MDTILYNFDNTVVTIILLVAASMSLGLAAYTHVKSYGNRVALFFEVGLLLAMVNILAYMYRRVAPNSYISYSLLLIEMTSFYLIGPISLLFVTAYNGHGMKRNRFLRAYVYLSALLLISILMDPWHRLLIRSYDNEVFEGGVLYILATNYILLSLLIALLLFVKGIKEKSIYWRQQLITISAGVVLPILIKIITEQSHTNLHIRYGMLIMPISLVLFTIAVLRFQFLDILPINLGDVVESIEDGFMVVNLDGMIEDFNIAFMSRFFDVSKLKSVNDLIDQMTSQINNMAVLDNIRYSLTVRRDNYVSGELYMRTQKGTVWLQYTTKAINDFYGVKIANIITFHDITELQNLYQALEEKKDELMLAKEKLENHLANIQNLTIETERNHLMVEVHDTLGHSMTEVLALLEKCDLILSEEPFDETKAKESVVKAINRSRESLAEIRASVSKFRKMGVSI